MKKVKRTKSFEAKIANQIAGISLFKAETIVNDIVTFNDLYKIDSDSTNSVNLDLLFLNSGVIVSSDVFVDKVKIFADIKGSINNTPIGICKAVHGKFLDIISTVSVSNITPLPSDLDIRITLSGGPSSITRQVGQTLKLTTVGQNVDVIISIIFF